MARKVWKLNKFDKGINSHTNAKDISDREWATLEDVNVSKVGIAKPLGLPTGDSSVHSTSVGDLISGKGLYRFSSDNTYMDEGIGSSWHFLENTQNAGNNNAVSQATFGIRSLVWLFSGKPGNIIIQFTLKVNGTPIMSAMPVLSGNLASDPFDAHYASSPTATSTNVFNKDTMIYGTGTGSVWAYDSIARNTNIPFRPAINPDNDNSYTANDGGESPAFTGAYVFWDPPAVDVGVVGSEILQAPLGNLNDPNLIFSATYNDASSPAPNGTLDFHNYYMLGFYAWDGYESNVDWLYQYILWWPITNEEFYVPQSKPSEDSGEVEANYQKARLSFLSELIKAINSYSGGSAVNQFSASFENYAPEVHQTAVQDDSIYMEPRTGAAAGNAGGDITADITCTGGDHDHLFYDSGINLLDDTDTYGQVGSGDGGNPSDSAISDEEVIDADGGSMVLQRDTEVSTGNAGTSAETWVLSIFGDPRSQKTIKINLIGEDALGSFEVEQIADFASNEDFANAIKGQIHALTNYSCSSATSVTNNNWPSPVYTAYSITITGDVTTLLGGFNMTVDWIEAEFILNDGSIGVTDEQLALISKTDDTLSTLDGVVLKKTDFQIWSDYSTTWLTKFSNSNSVDINNQIPDKYLSWVYTPQQNNDPVFYDEGSMLRISESNFQLLEDLRRLYVNNNIVEEVNGELVTLEPNPTQWLGYKDLSNHFKDRNGNKYFEYLTKDRGWFLEKLAKIWSYSMSDDESVEVSGTRFGVSPILDNDLQGTTLEPGDIATNGTDLIGYSEAVLQFFMAKGESGGFDWSGNIKVYAAACYDDGSESLPGHFFKTFAGTNTDNYFGDVGGGTTLKIELVFRPQSVSEVKVFNDTRINGVRLYYTHSEEAHSTFWNLGKLDFKRGFIKAATVDTVDDTIGNEATYEWRTINEAPEDGVSAYNDYAVDNLTVYDSSSNSFTIEYKEMPKSQSYEDINGHSARASTLNVGYKAVCIAGRRTFVGNIKVWNGSDYEYYNDRMVVSPINSLDSFPYPDNILDLDISDGDEIVALAAYGDKVIQFKKRTAYIMNISTGMASEFYIEERHKWKGISDKNHFCTTDDGIFWFNERGAWIYDGDEIIDLFILDDEDTSQQKIDSDEWQSFVSSDSLVGYNAPSRDIIIVKNHTHASSEDADCFIFSLIVNSWTKGKKRFFSAANKSMTNIQNSGNTGKLTFLLEENPGGVADSGEIR